MSKKQKGQTQKEPISNQYNKTETSLIRYVPYLLLVVIFIFSFQYIFDVKLDQNGDNYNYLNYSQSILDGHGYSSPTSPDYPAVNHFPPGYPVILALAKLVTGGGVVPLKILNGLFFLGGILLLFSLIKNLTHNLALAFSVSVLILLNSGLLRFSTIIMAEMSYFFFSALAFYLIYKLNDEKQFWKSKYFYGLAISIALGYYIRTIGITLFGAVILHYLFTRQWKISGALFGSFIALNLPWVFRNSLLGLESRYLGTVMTVNPWRPEEGQISSVSEFVKKMITNFDDTVIRGFTEVIFPFVEFKTPTPSGTMMVLAGLLLLAVVLWGSWSLKKYRYLFVFYTLANIFIFMVWHGGNGARYVWPLAPFIAFCFFIGIYAIISRFKAIPEKLLQKIPFAILIIVFFMSPPLKKIHQQAQSKMPPAYENYFQIAKQMKKSGLMNSMVACRKPGMFHYYSGTFTTNYKYSLDDKEIIANFIELDVKYVVLEQLGFSSTQRYLYPAIQKNNELFNSISQLKNPDTYLLQFNIEKAREKLKL